MTVVVGMRLVEQFHGDQIDAAAFHGKSDEIHQTQSSGRGWRPAPGG